MKLVICEKKSVGEAIAASLNVSNKKQGYMENDEYIISWAQGHLIHMLKPDEYDPKYKNWDLDHLPIIPVEFKYAVDENKKNQYQVLKSLMDRNDVTSLINACDAGREGELIFRYIVNEANCHKPTERLWISSMEEKAIKEGFQNLKPGNDYDALYESGIARARADWLVGLNMTRLFSSLYHKTLNIGRVQTPILAMIVERQNKIDNFQKEKYHLLHLSLDGADAVSDRITDQAQALLMMDLIKGKQVTCSSVSKETKKNKAPKLYDLTTLQREANRYFGFTAQKTLDLAQVLYEKKILTYPRTDSRALTSDMEASVLEIIDVIKEKYPFNKCASFTPNVKATISDKDVSDHHAIIPTQEIQKIQLDSLEQDEKNLLLLVMTRLLAATSDAYINESTKATFLCEGITFTAKGKHTLQEGYKEIEKIIKKKEEEKDDDQLLPEYTEGKVFSANYIDLSEHYTTPPKPFTEDTLLSAMENAGAEEMPDEAERKGLGTPATRSNIIEKLVKDGYVVRKGKTMLPTDYAKKLLKVIPDILKTPLLTADWEEKLIKIAKKEKKYEDFLNEIQILIVEVLKDNPVASEEGLKMFMETGESLGICPRCGNKVYEGNSGYHCSDRSCGFSMWKRSKFWVSKKKALTRDMVSSLLKDGKVEVKGLYSPKTNKKYDATVLLDDTGEFVNFKLEFEKKDGGKN